MKARFFFLGLLFGNLLVAAPDAPRERLSFNADWRFTKGDPAGVGTQLAYDNIKAWLLPSGAAFTANPAAQAKRPEGNLAADVAYIQPGFNDTSWRSLTLPHDWGIEGPFDQKLPGETGKLPWAGIAWYRKHFTVPAGDADRHISVEIDGAMAYAAVWCNGRFVGGWPYGYSSFRLDLTPYLKTGADNVVAIRLDNPEASSRWYPGGGIYRNVWLVKTAPVHVAHWGTYVTTPQITPASATVNLRATVANDSTSPATVTVKTSIFDGAQLVVEAAPQSASITAGQSSVVSTQFTVPKPKLWDLATPHRYTAVTVVVQAGRVVDRYETPFGIRTIAFTVDDGFHLNGRRVQLYGVCNHHDLGALGAAFNTRAAERQLEILKEMGVNALRTSHNPPAPELLDLCDRMGILVMDESFDCWKRGKKGGDYNKLWDDWHEQDLRAEYRRDRNHPSIILWSIGNEVIELRDKEAGPAIAASLTAIAHEEDPTRPTVLGSNAGEASYNGVQKGVDVMGQNYQYGGYGRFRKENPTIPLVGSETSSCVSSRGEYFFETPEQVAAFAVEAAKQAVAKGKAVPKEIPFSPVSEDKNHGKSDFQVSSYDLYAPGWGCPPDKEFFGQETSPHVAGEFVWTGFDYLGEPTPYNGDTTNMLNFHDAEGQAEMARQLKELGKIKVPSRSSYFGIVDLAGFKKDRFYLYQSHWRPELPMAHILPHWNWPERVGLVTPVHVYTSGDEAELFLNGVSQGRKKKGTHEYRLRWNGVVYQTGELKVIAYKNGQQWATEVVKTTGPASKLLLSADRNRIHATGTDLSFVTVTVADAAGLLVPRSKNLVTFSVTGPGEIVAVDNGDATSFEPFQASQRKAYNGLALVIVRAKPGVPGAIKLHAESAGLAPADVSLAGF